MYLQRCIIESEHDFLWDVQQKVIEIARVDLKVVGMVLNAN